jgi:hypothetical protein
MKRSRLWFVTLLVLVGIALVAGSYTVGRRTRAATDVAFGASYAKAIIAFAHYKQYGYVVGYLEKKCYDDALLFAKETRDEQVGLLARNLRRTGNDPRLIDYLQHQDPELLKSILAGHIPEDRPFTTLCAPDAIEHKPEHAAQH